MKTNEKIKSKIEKGGSLDRKIKNMLLCKGEL